MEKIMITIARQYGSGGRYIGDLVAKELGMQVFLLTDDLINKSGEDISNYPHGDFKRLLEFIDEVLNENQ